VRQALDGVGAIGDECAAMRGRFANQCLPASSGGAGLQPKPSRLTMLLIGLVLLGAPAWCAAADSFISRNARAPEAMVYGPDDPRARQSQTPDAVPTPTPPDRP
jgi:hypothetical protein